MKKRFTPLAVGIAIGIVLLVAFSFYLVYYRNKNNEGVSFNLDENFCVDKQFGQTICSNDPVVRCNCPQGGPGSVECFLGNQCPEGCTLIENVPPSQNANCAWVNSLNCDTFGYHSNIKCPSGFCSQDNAGKVGVCKGGIVWVDDYDDITIAGHACCNIDQHIDCYCAELGTPPRQAY